MCVFFSHSDFVLARLKHQHLFPFSPSDEDNVPHVEPLRTPVLIKTSPVKMKSKGQMLSFSYRLRRTQTRQRSEL